MKNFQEFLHLPNSSKWTKTAINLAVLGVGMHVRFVAS